MCIFLPTIVLRHRKENLKKCSLRGLEERLDFNFLTYPLQKELPFLGDYVMLSLEGEPLKASDKGLFLVDATWRYAEKMIQRVDEVTLVKKRTLPKGIKTAYPRKQNDCSDPERGLASIEALVCAFAILGRDWKGLLQNYYWKDKFLALNRPWLEGLESNV